MSIINTSLLPLQHDEEEACINLYRALDEECDFLIEWEQSIKEREKTRQQNKLKRY